MVKGVATSIITVAVLMGSVVACGGSDNQLSEEEKNEWIVLCSAVVEDYNCAQLAQAMGELITDNVADKACIKEEMLIFAGYKSNSTNSEAQYKRMQDLCRKDKEEETSLSDESESSPPPTSTPVPTAEPAPTPTPVPEPTPTLEPTPTPIPQPQDQIYFRNGNELFSMNSDGTNVIQLTDIANIENSEYSYEYEIDSVQVSPNGKRILYGLYGLSRQFNEDGSYKSVDELWVVDVESGNSIQVAIAERHDDTYESIYYSQWSSDSSRIYFDISGKNYVINSDGTAKRQDGCGQWNSALSPDGRRIAQGGYQIYVSDNFCANEQQVTNEVDKMFSGLVWSPDGTKIAALYFMGCKQCREELYIADMTPYVYDDNPSPTFENNPNLGQITDSVGGIGRSFDWSPDSNSIVFTQVRSPGGYVGAIYVADLDENGTSFRWLTDGSSPKYFPEGEKIVFIRWDEEDLQEAYSQLPPPEIFTMNADGTNIISTGRFGHPIAVKP